jgi:hypothetical protein
VVTLVVADLEEGGVTLVGDTQLTDPRTTTRPHLFNGALKIVTLQRGIAVAYAGDHHAAVGAIRALDVNRDSAVGSDEIEHALLREHRSWNGAIDFLVASLYPTVRLSAIRDGVIAEPSGGRSWIGDIAGFNHFQLAASLNPGVSTRQILREAMASVIADPSIPHVGGIVVAVYPSRHGFFYSGGVELVSDGRQVIPSGVLTDVTWAQGAATGSFTQILLTPPDASGIGAIGLFLREASAGALYHPLASPDPIVISATTQNEFVADVEARFDIQLSGLELR